MPKLFKTWVIIALFPFLCSQLYATYFQWDPAGSATRLKDLNINKTDKKTEPSEYINDYEHFNQDGYLGRLIYQGEANNTIKFNNAGPIATGNGSDSTKFYYTKSGDTSCWRRVFFVLTIKGLTHNSSLSTDARTVLLSTNNALIVSNGDSLTIPAGAGSELLDPGLRSDTVGYDLNGNSGTGSSFIYKYPYEYIWMDITTVRTNDSRDLFNNYGGYESILHLQGNGISSQLYVIGYRAFFGLPFEPYYNTQPHTFSVERICEECIPFSRLMLKDSSANAYPVGMVRYNSSGLQAKVTFTSDVEGNSVDFRFKSGPYSFPYSLVFIPITPTGETKVINSLGMKFGSTSSKITFTSPSHGETTDEYIMLGELQIFVAPALKFTTLPAKTYSSTIYCHLSSE